MVQHYCRCCNGKVNGAKKMLEHILACNKVHKPGGTETIYTIRIQEHTTYSMPKKLKDSPKYFLFVNVNAKAYLTTLDKCLRDVWLDCCGHLSSFDFGKDREYYSDGYEDGDPMTITLERVFNGVVGTKFIHKYDFGSTTELVGELINVRNDASGPKNGAVQILSRNSGDENDNSPRCGFCGYEGESTDDWKPPVEEKKRKTPSKPKTPKKKARTEEEE